MIDARGRLTASLGLNETGVVDAPLPGARPEPPYARTGDAPWHGVLGLGMLVLLAAVLRRRKAIDDARPTG
jgi:apolipoprotein N-acyltransferase